ncbi:MAG: hypothetical protein LBJ41_09020 [Treponema sp.]|jgi:hypothetical protein|nr:hypothetical protein [Treponema sp.]
MNIKLNRIIMSLLSALFVFALISYNLEIPESVKIKSQPGLYISLGSPLDGTGMSFNEYLSEEELRKQLNSGERTQGIELIDDWNDPNNEELQTYLVYYPIADININLSEYVENMNLTSNVTNVSGGWIPGGSKTDITLHPDSISFTKEVKEVMISLTLTFIQSFTPPDPDAPSETDVPDGANVTFTGKEVFESPNTPPTLPNLQGNKWVSPEFDLEPAKDQISISIIVPIGYWFKPELEFEWASSILQLDNDGTKKGEYKLDLSKFSKFMGAGISFQKVTGYMYLQKPDDNILTASATVKLTWKEDGISEEETVKPIEEEFPTDWESFNPSSIDEDSIIKFTDLFKHSYTLEYELTLKEATIKKENNPTGRFAVDIVIVLPLGFKLDQSSDIFTNYNKLDINALQNQGAEGLLGKTGVEDDMFKGLESVNILVSNYNKIIDGLWFGVKIDEDTTQIADLGGQVEIIPITSIPNRFTPTFELLVEKNKTLRILKPQLGKDTAIDINIAEAKTDMDYRVKF